MGITAGNYKNWCSETISPQSWTRICLKCVDLIRSRGLSLKQMENPEPDFEIPQDLLDQLNEALAELYDLVVDERLLIRY